VIKKRWRALSPGVRRIILTAAALDGLLKTAALTDLIRRPSAQIRGSKTRWAAAIVLLNSGGALPLIYFRRGRRSTG
jgi:hypothetical protein